MIEEKLGAAVRIVPEPWVSRLETREPLGGCSFVQAGGDADEDYEIYVDVLLNGDRLVSPDAPLDSVVDLLGTAPDLLRLLVAEVRRLQVMSR